MAAAAAGGEADARRDLDVPIESPPGGASEGGQQQRYVYTHCALHQRVL